MLNSADRAGRAKRVFTGYVLPPSSLLPSYLPEIHKSKNFAHYACALAAIRIALDFLVRIRTTLIANKNMTPVFLAYSKNMNTKDII